MKFDAIIMNPPYNSRPNGQLSDNILTKLTDLKIATNIVTIQPMNALFTINAPRNLQRKLKGHLKSVRMVNGNLIWPQLAFKTPLAISNILPNEFFEEVYYENNICNFFNIPVKKYKSLVQELIPSHSIQTSIIEKSKQLIKTIGSLKDIKGNKPGHFFCKFNAMIGHTTNKNGHFYDNDMFKLINKKGYDHNVSSKRFLSGPNEDEHFYFCFRTEEEARNCYDFIRSPFVQLLNTKYKTNAATKRLFHIPLFDFSTPITNERLMTEVGLSLNELEFIDDFVKLLNAEKVDWSKYE